MNNSTAFKNMSRKEKWEHIWEYYKWHIIGVIVLILVVAEVFRIVTAPKPPEYSTDIVIAGKVQPFDTNGQYENNLFSEELDAGVSYIPGGWDRPDSNTMVSDQKLMLMLQTRDIDLFIMSKFKYEAYGKIEKFDPFYALDEIPELAGLLEQYKDQLITGKSNEDGTEHIYGIMVKPKELDEIPANFGEDLVVSIIGTPKNLEGVVATMKYLLE